MKRRLVALDGEQVVGPGIEGRLGDGDLAAHGIGRDQGTLEIEPLDQSRYRGDLVGFFKYRLLAKHQPAVGREGRQDRKSTRLNSSHRSLSRMPSSA